MKFSEKIVYMRKMRKISQDRLAKKMGVSRQTIYKWEADLNTPEFNKIEKLAEILDISYNLLLDDSIDLEKYFSENEDSVTNNDSSESEEDISQNDNVTNNTKRLSKKSIIIITLVSVFVIALIVTVALLLNEFLNSHINASTDSDSNVITDTDTDVDTDTDTVNTVLVYFDADGGEIKEKSRKVEIGSQIGELPIPTKEGYVFAYWKTVHGVKINKNTVIDSDVILYAVYEDKSNSIEVTLNSNGGVVNTTTLTLGKGSKIYDYLPTPIHNEGLEFVGWFDEKGVKVLPHVTYSTDKSLTAYWGKLDTCPSTKGKHAYGYWNYNNQMAGCENDGYATRTCQVCYYEDRKITEKALGHDYNVINYEVMSEWSECERCGHIKNVKYINLNDTCIGNTMIEGNILGREYYYAVFDGEFDSFTGPGCAENEKMTLYIYLKEYTYVDCIFTQGKGEMDFTISIITPPNEEYIEFCSGSFEDEVQRFEINKYVLAIKIHTNNAEGHWQEIALAQIPKEEK